MNKNIVQNILKVFIILVGVTLIYNGVVWAFFPNTNLDTYSIIVNAPEGMNMIRSDIGGPLAIAGAFAVLYGVKGKTWFLPTLLIASSYLVPRIVSLFIDGVNQVSIMGVGVEVFFIVLLLINNRTLI